MSDSEPGSSLAKRTYLGFIWQSIGLSVNTLLSLSHLVIMARLLTPEVFGQFAIASILVAIMTIVTEMGLGSALIQKDELNEIDRSFVFLSNVCIAFLILILLFFVAEPLSRYLDHAFSPLLIQVLGVNILVVSLGMASKATLQREMRFNKIVFATSISYLIGTLLAGIAIALMGFGVWALVIGLLINNTILTLYFLIQAPIKLMPAIADTEWPKMIKYGAGLCVVQGVNQFSRMSDKLILATLSTLGFVGLYERSQQVQQMPGVFLGGIFDNVLFPALSRISRNPGEMGNHFFQFCTPAMIVSAYLSVLIFTFSSDLIHILLGAQWVEAIPILKLLAVLTFFQLLGRLSDTYVRATGIFASSIKVKICFLILVVGASFTGYQLAGDFGVIVGIVVASILHAIMMMLVCSRHASYSKKKLLMRAQPALLLAVILLVKNALVLSIGLESALSDFGLILITDAVVFWALYSVSFLVGVENKIYLERRIREFSALVRERIQ